MLCFLINFKNSSILPTLVFSNLPEMQKNLTSFFFFLIIGITGFSQQSNFTRQDTLRGTITSNRIWWDLLHYDLDMKVDPSTKSLQGSNIIRYKVLKNNQRMQIDLQPPMEITKITQDNQTLEFMRDGNAYFILLKKQQTSKLPV